MINLAKGNFILTSKAVNGASYPEVYITYADALVGKEEYNRAMVIFITNL